MYVVSCHRPSNHATSLLLKEYAKGLRFYPNLFNVCTGAWKGQSAAGRLGEGRVGAKGNCLYRLRLSPASSTSSPTGPHEGGGEHGGSPPAATRTRRCDLYIFLSQTAWGASRSADGKGKPKSKSGPNPCGVYCIQGTDSAKQLRKNGTVPTSGTIGKFQFTNRVTVCRRVTIELSATAEDADNYE